MPPPYHDFDSGDCYILLAESYLAIGDTDQAMTSMENSVLYYLRLVEICKGDEISLKTFINCPLVWETELNFIASKSVIKEKILNKLSSDDIKPLRNGSVSKICTIRCVLL